MQSARILMEAFLACVHLGTLEMDPPAEVLHAIPVVVIIAYVFQYQVDK